MARVCLVLAVALAAFCAPPARADDSWITEAIGVKPLKPPFKQTFYAGEFGRVAILKDMAVRLVQGQGSSRGTVVLVPLKGEKRVGQKEILKEEPLVLLNSPLETDSVAFKVITGVVALEADADAMPEVVIEEGKKTEIKLTPMKEAVGRFVNASDFRSTCTYTFFADGADVSRSNDWDRTITLEFMGSNLTKTWKVAADRIVVEAVRGKVLVKIGHPFGKGG